LPPGCAKYAPPTPGSEETLRGQLDRLVAVAGLSTVELAILPLRAPMPALPMAGFAIHDDRFVLVETLTAEQRLDEPGEVAVYRTVFEHLLSAAAHGDEALAIIRTVADTPARANARHTPAGPGSAGAVPLDRPELAAPFPPAQGLR